MKTLEYYGGCGVEYIKEFGEFEVKTDKKIKKFTQLSKAKTYYDGLLCDKFLWKSNGMPELIIGHHYIDTKHETTI